MPRIHIENRVRTKYPPWRITSRRRTCIGLFHTTKKVMEKISTNRKISVQKQLKQHYLTQLSFCFGRTSTSDTSL